MTYNPVDYDINGIRIFETDTFINPNVYAVGLSGSS